MKQILSSIYLLMFLLCSFVAIDGRADYFVIPVTSEVLNPQSRTHVVVATRGNDLGTALQYAEASKIWRLKAL